MVIYKSVADSKTGRYAAQLKAFRHQMRHFVLFWDVSYERSDLYHAMVSFKRSVVIQYHYHYRVRRDCVCVCLTWQQRRHSQPSLLCSLPSENAMANCVRWPQYSPHINGSLVAFICVQSFILGVFNFS